jgi:hypothetical protein
LPACQFWKANQAAKKLTRKTWGEAVSEYLARQRHLSARRQHALESYFSTLGDRFSKKYLDEITTADLKSFIFGRTAWKSPKTRNEIKGAVGLLYRDAAEQSWVPQGYDPSAAMKAEKIKPGDVGIYLPAQVRQIMASLPDDMALPMALWFFGGCRKENLARIPIESLRAALGTGWLKIAASEDRKTGARAVKLEDNLRVWIEWFLVSNPDASGTVLPAKYGAGNKIDNFTRKIASRSKLAWVDNAPRHSCISFWIARGENVQTVAKWAGNSLTQIQRHYWRRDESITADMARDYFSILPPRDSGNIVPMAQMETAPEPIMATPPAERLNSVKG